MTGANKSKGKAKKRMGKILTRPRRKSVSPWQIWHFRVRERVCAGELRVFIATKRKVGRREMGILGKLLSSVSLVSIWCLVIVEPGKVQREQDHLGKSSFYCICTFGFHFWRHATLFQFRDHFDNFSTENAWKVRNEHSEQLTANNRGHNYQLQGQFLI